MVSLAASEPANKLFEEAGIVDAKGERGVVAIMNILRRLSHRQFPKKH
jgi:hypothetical protein